MLADTAAHTPAGFEAWYAGLLLGDAVPDAPALQLALRVHANNALDAATDALASDFPVLGAMLGADAFAALALRHARAHPPTDPRLCLYGKGLDNSIAAAAELADWPWLADHYSVRSAYWIILPCYLYLVYYATIGHKKRHW